MYMRNISVYIKLRGPDLQCHVTWYIFLQVMSESVAKALPIVVGPAAERTAQLVQVVDTMFDCLNVTSYMEGKRRRKPSKDPYTSAMDWRLDVS